MQQTTPDAPRTLLGRPTPFVGRDAELAALEDIARESARTCRAHAVVITAPAGFGKSRLRYELLRRLAAQPSPPELLLCRGDPLRQGAAYQIFADPLRTAFLREAQGEAQALFPAQWRVTLFLRELAGLGASPAQDTALRAARQDPRLMEEQLRFALLYWLDALSKKAPLVLVLDNIHWGDAPSVKLIDTALGALRERPCFVLALGRPEVSERFPELWAEHKAEALPLRGLPPQASSAFCRAFLGADTDEERVARLVSLAGGNAFYLEELIRAEVSGTALPNTVLSGARAQLMALPEAQRRVLAAASVLGKLFWGSAVSALLEEPPDALEQALFDLARREVITRRHVGRFAGEVEYAFRHELLREVAYASLSEDERALLHRRAGAWLDAAGERAPTVLAEHFDRGGDASRALRFYYLAAERAFVADDIETVTAIVARALSLGAAGEERAAFLRLSAGACSFRGDLDGEERDILAALPDAIPQSPLWFSLQQDMALLWPRRGEKHRFDAVVRALLESEAQDFKAIWYQINGCINASTHLFYEGRHEEVEALLAKAEAIAARLEPEYPADAARGQLLVRARRAIFNNDLSAMDMERRLIELDLERGSLRGANLGRLNLGFFFCEIGRYEEGAEVLRKAEDYYKRMGHAYYVALARQNLGLCLLRQGDLPTAIALEQETADFFAQGGHKLMQCASRYYLAMALGLARRYDEAIAEVGRAIALARDKTASRACALAVLAQIELWRRAAPEALSAAREAHQLLEELGVIDEYEGLIRLVYAEALLVNGREEEGRAALSAARERLLLRAEKIATPKWRQSFLFRVAEHAKTLALARELLDTSHPDEGEGAGA